MTARIDTLALAALDDQPLDWRFKGMPAQWSGHTPNEICAQAPELFASAPMGPICVLSAPALAHNIAVMRDWCARHGVELAPHGKTHMSPALAAAQLAAGACAITVATISQMRVYRAFGVRDFILANELVDRAGLHWLAAQLNGDPTLAVLCWVDSIRGVQIMSTELAAAGLTRPLDVCVEVGAAGGRTGTRSPEITDEVARAVTDSAQLRLVGVAGYEAALGHDVSAPGRATIRDYLLGLRASVLRLAGVIEDDTILVSAGGSTHFDLVAEILGQGWPAGLTVRTVLRSGCYLTHDEGLYRRTSPLARPGTAPQLRPAMSVWAQVCSRPEPGLALLTMGRRDVSFDQDLPLVRGIAGAELSKLNDQHAYLRLGSTAERGADVGDWLEFGISHPCTVFDKWPMIPVVDADNRVVQLVRTYF